MGLDTVELVMAIEEEFKMEIPDQDAEKITTVGEMYDYLRKRLGSKPPGSKSAARCVSQRLFYASRRALMNTYGIPRRRLTLDARLSDLVPADDLKEGWPYLELFEHLKFPRLDPGWWPIGLRHDARMLTLRELVGTMLTLNKEKLLIDPGSDEDVWTRLSSVIVAQLNVHVGEIRYNASFTRDLGAD